MNETTAKSNPKVSKNLLLGGLGGIILLCVICLVIGYIGSQDPEYQATATTKAIAAINLEQTDAAKPTNTKAPTNTPAPTKTRMPTYTRAPTNTPRPSNTPRPTNTPTIPPTPTSTPEPIHLTGNGSDIVDIDKWDGPAIIVIDANASSRHFALTNYDANNNPIDLLVNTTDPYTGIRPLDWRDGEDTHRLEITATGDWIITILPVSSMAVLEVPGKFEGNGDFVFQLAGQPADLAIIVGNQDSRHFAVLTYSTEGIDLLENTTEPVDNKYMMDGGVFAIEVKATGPWSIEITAN